MSLFHASQLVDGVEHGGELSEFDRFSYPGYFY
jgi:hypothetical protein